jgi:Ni/Fe-hydrogenase 1 B-type cytochrome subunit
MGGNMASARSEALREVTALDGVPERRVEGLVDHSMMHSVYVYEAPVRLWHWVTVLAMLALSATGYLIGKPLPAVGGEASDHYVMGYVRLIHFISGYVFTIAFLGRIYWHIVGNKWARQLFTPPVFSGNFWGGLVHQLKFYLFLTREPRQYVAHNPMANLAMFLMFALVGVFMIFTGFALYSEGLGIDSWAGRMFGWVIPLIGQSQDVHTFHRLGMWVMVMFAIFHIYMAFREDILSKKGIVSSMVNGYRYMKD